MPPPLQLPLAPAVLLPAPAPASDAPSDAPSSDAPPDSDEEEVHELVVGQVMRAGSGGYRDVAAVGPDAAPRLAYQVGQLLSTDASGELRVCLHLGTGQLMVMKELVRPEGDNAAAWRARMEALAREVGRLRTVSHPSMVRYFGVHVSASGARARLFTEMVAGGSLNYVMSRFGGLDEHTARAYVRQAAEALAHLHRVGVVHGAVSSDCVLLASNGVVKLTGLISAWRLRWGPTPTTASGTAAAVAVDAATGKVDVWGLGILAYELLSGKSGRHCTCPDPAVAAAEALAVTPIRPDTAAIVNVLTGSGEQRAAAAADARLPPGLAAKLAAVPPPYCSLPLWSSPITAVSLGAAYTAIRKATPRIHAERGWSPAALGFIRECLNGDRRSRPDITAVLKHPFLAPLLAGDDDDAAVPAVAVPPPRADPGDAHQRIPRAVAVLQAATVGALSLAALGSTLPHAPTSGFDDGDELGSGGVTDRDGLNSTASAAGGSGISGVGGGGGGGASARHRLRREPTRRRDASDLRFDTGATATRGVSDGGDSDAGAAMGVAGTSDTSRFLSGGGESRTTLSPAPRLPLHNGWAAFDPTAEANRRVGNPDAMARAEAERRRRVDEQGRTVAQRMFLARWGTRAARPEAVPATATGSFAPLTTSRGTIARGFTSDIPDGLIGLASGSWLEDAVDVIGVAASPPATAAAAAGAGSGARAHSRGRAR